MEETVHLRARYAYTAKRPDELSFEKKEHFILLSKSGKGWWKAKNDKQQTGLVASNYVAIIAAPKKVEEKKETPIESRESILPPVTPAPKWDDESRESVLAVTKPAPQWDDDSSFDSFAMPKHGDILEDSNVSLAQTEKQLEELLEAVEDDRKRTNKIIEDAERKVEQATARADELEKKLWELEERIQNEREENVRKEKANTELWQSMLEAAEEKAASLTKGSKVDVAKVEEIEALKIQISKLEKEKKDLVVEHSRKSGAFEDMFKEEREIHKQTNERCQELTEMYESARKIVKDLEGKLTKSQREVISKKAEMKELKKKTGRMAELFKKQKSEMEEKLMGHKEDKAEGKKVAELETKLLLEKQENERLRVEIASLKKAEKERQTAEVYEVVPTFLPSVPAPPPPLSSPPKKGAEKRAAPKKFDNTVKNAEPQKKPTLTVKRPSRSKLDNVVAKIRTSQREDGVEFRTLMSNVVDNDTSPISESEAAFIFNRTNSVVKLSKQFKEGFPTVDAMHAAFKDGILLCVHLSLLCPKDIDVRAMNQTCDDDRDRQENFSLWLGSARMAGARFPRTITKETFATATKEVMIGCLWQNIKCGYAIRFQKEPNVRAFVASFAGVSEDQVRDEWGSNMILWSWVNAHLKKINQEEVKTFADLADSIAFIFLLDRLFQTGTKALSISNTKERAVEMLKIAAKVGCKTCPPDAIVRGHGRMCYALLGEIFASSLTKNK